MKLYFVWTIWENFKKNRYAENLIQMKNVQAVVPIEILVQANKIFFIFSIDQNNLHIIHISKVQH